MAIRSTMDQQETTARLPKKLVTFPPKGIS